MRIMIFWALFIGVRLFGASMIGLLDGVWIQGVELGVWEFKAWSLGIWGLGFKP